MKKLEATSGFLSRCASPSWKSQVRLALIVASIAFCGLLDRAVAQVVIPNVTLVQISGPGHAYPTEILSLCYAKLDYPYTPENRGSSESGGESFAPKKAAKVTLRIVEMTTGTEVAKNVIFVAPGALPADPCAEYVVPAATTTSTARSNGSAVTVPASTPAYIGIVSVSSEPVPPSAVTSSFQIYTLGADGLPVSPRVIPPSVTCPADDFVPCSY